MSDVPLAFARETLNETDRRVLQAMLDGSNYTAPELAARLDESREYLNVRLSHLETVDALERVERGLYRIDDNGRTLAEVTA